MLSLHAMMIVSMLRSSNAAPSRLLGYMEGPWHHFYKYVWFFAYNLRMERDRDTVLLVTWLSAQCITYKPE